MQRVTAEHVESELGHAAVVLAPVQLRDRGFGAERPLSEHTRQDAQAQESHDLAAGVHVRQSLADDAGRCAAPVARARDQPIELGAEEDRVRGGFLASLEPEQRRRNRPSVVDVADDVIGRRDGVVEEDLVEFAVTGESPYRPDVDARLVERDEEERDAAVLRRIGVGASEKEDPVGFACRETSTASVLR